MSFKEKIADFLKLGPVIPVIEIERVEDALPLAESLLEGGLKSIEITLRTEAALPAIREIAHHAPDMKIGAGTILNGDMLVQAIEAGSHFGVSPGATEALLADIEKEEFPFLPGGTTASEVMNLRSHGYHYQKFFPAEAAGGIPMIKSLGGPIADVQFCPTGGVNMNNLNDYHALKNVIVVGGTWIANKDLIRAKNWSQITENAAACLNALKG